MALKTQTNRQPTLFTGGGAFFALAVLVIAGILFFNMPGGDQGTYAGQGDLCVELPPIYDYTNGGDAFVLSDYKLSDLCKEGTVAYTGGGYIASGAYHAWMWYCIDAEGNSSTCTVQELRCGDTICQGPVGENDLRGDNCCRQDCGVKCGVKEADPKEPGPSVDDGGER